MADIGNTLAERGSRYGVFAEHANITQRLKMVMYDTPKFGDLENDQIEALDMIAHKIGRILNGDPNYADSWVDIAGYAKLVADRLELREKNIAAENLAKEVSRIDVQARDVSHVVEWKEQLIERKPGSLIEQEYPKDDIGGAEAFGL